ncbi:MAG: hypothetical protein F6K36_20185 [Symploca sp. SIO3C6]|uniref:Uncharacterized protein n=1 Tax=Symploca sp. SIO1C4 TaxID=2607765 RepID=A0A6B3N8U0_9CYAN|nr:hypothetical protein [Symploca sp. SIO3C6]NER28057.1 hypothetical protein [Symploca sp. SIO1C4]
MSTNYAFLAASLPKWIRGSICYGLIIIGVCLTAWKLITSNSYKETIAVFA